MDQTTKTRRAIADAMAVFSPFKDQSPDSRDVIDRAGAELTGIARARQWALIAESRLAGLV